MGYLPILLLILLTFGNGCAHPQRGVQSDEPTSLSEVTSSDGNSKAYVPPSHYSAKKLVVQGVELKNTEFDFPLVVNSHVEYWVDYFTGRGRRHFTLYLRRSEYFIPFIQPILQALEVPQDLVYLAMIESGFNNHARSRARAVGPWQFIRSTGRRYGLNVNWWVDERRDIKKSTIAAVRYLKDLYELFRNWELAAASYNAGETKVMRGIRRYHTKDFWSLARHRFLRPETRNYVPKIMAAMILAKNRDQFGFPSREEFQELEKDKGIKQNENEEAQILAAQRDEDEEISEQEQNEDLLDILQEQDGDYVYEGRSPATLINFQSLDHDPDEREVHLLAKELSTPHVVKHTGEVGGEELVEFEVQSPADLRKIAQAAGLSYEKVKSLNPAVLRWCTPPSQETYAIKLPQDVKKRFLLTYNHPDFPREVRFKRYKVRRGDTLRRIARRYRIRIEPIRQLNGIRSSRGLKSGVEILLPLRTKVQSRQSGKV